MIKSILEESVIKWRHAALLQRKPIGTSDCHLCDLYYSTECEYCPIAIYTKSPFCAFTPYGDWVVSDTIKETCISAYEESIFFITLLEDY